MKPQSMLTVRFVKRFLAVLIGAFLLIVFIPGISHIVGYTLVSATLLTIAVLQWGFPKTQITVDEESIRFKREFQHWNPLKKYYLNELVIPHEQWDNWVKIFLTDVENNNQNFYLFFKDDRLCFAAETRQNGDLEYWIQQKFPDRILDTRHSFKRYEDRYDRLKEKHRMRVF